MSRVIATYRLGQVKAFLEREHAQVVLEEALKKRQRVHTCLSVLAKRCGGWLPTIVQSWETFWGEVKDLAGDIIVDDQDNPVGLHFSSPTDTCGLDQEEHWEVYFSGDEAEEDRRIQSGR